MKRLLIGDFNTETSESRIDSFIYEHDLQNLVKEKTCFKSVENPSCIDLILTNNAILMLDYKNFDSVRFKDELKYVLVKEKITSCIKFDEMFLQILNQHAPL